MNSLVVLVSCSRFIAALVHCPELLLVGRFLASILTGVLFPTLITFLQESAPTRIRGALSAASEIMFSLMGLIGFAISLPSILGSDVRLLFGIPIIVAVIAVLILIPLHETPKFLLIERNDRDAAIKSIKFYHGKHANVEQVLQNIEIEAKEEEEKSSYIEILKTPYLRKAVLIGVVLLQVVVPAWGMFVKGTVFSQKAGFSEIEAGNVQTIAGFTFFLGTWMCAFTVEKLGRRPLVLTFTIGTTIPVILFMIFGLLQANVSWFKYLCAVCLTSYLFLYGGIGTIAWFFMTELVPQHHRTYVQAICNFVHIYIVFGLMFALDALLKAISLWAFIPLYIVPNIFCFIFLYFNMPETKNKEIYEIVRKLRGDQKNIDY
uniref:Major facilitator superfamily (MFS) profile domain-containing protein n=1 Tax=Panagrolaimus sp. JU765 TaxID=591449 RepID=A0AC34QFE3_9BILA